MVFVDVDNRKILLVTDLLFFYKYIINRVPRPRVFYSFSFATKTFFMAFVINCFVPMHYTYENNIFFLFCNMTTVAK
jgi:hypothetical protein